MLRRRPGTDTYSQEEDSVGHIQIYRNERENYIPSETASKNSMRIRNWIPSLKTIVDETETGMNSRRFGMFQAQLLYC